MKTADSDRHFLPIDLALGLATVPVLGGLMVANTLQQGAIALGELSEEVFRGDRLPILPFPKPTAVPDAPES